MLSKDPLIFSQVLSAFVQWAKCSEQADLTFMIPTHDKEAKDIFFNFLSNSFYLFDGKIFALDSHLFA
jgi:hypothetical protein